MKKVLISGSSSGIGRGLSERLLSLNYEVVGLARDHRKFTPDNPHYFPYPINFANIHEIETLLAPIKKKHTNIDAIVCCAGYGYFAELEQFSLAQIQRLINVNVISQIALIKMFLSQLKHQRQGKIIVLGSETALAGAKKASIYSASKFALRGFCQSLRHECRSAGISVTLVNPGLVRTPFFDTLNFMPQELAINALEINDIVATLFLVLQAEAHCVFEEISLQPICPQVVVKN